MPILLLLIAAVLGLWFFGILDFNVDDPGQLPDVTVEGGRAQMLTWMSAFRTWMLQLKSEP
jgi:hypothetical protein